MAVDYGTDMISGKHVLTSAKIFGFRKNIPTSAKVHGSGKNDRIPEKNRGFRQNQLTIVSSLYACTVDCMIESTS